MSRTAGGRQPLFTRVLGPAAFGATATLLTVLVGVGLAIRTLVEVQSTGSAHERLFMTRGMVLVAVLFLQAMMVYSEASRCYRRSGEQALVRLAPAAPEARAINRLLARYLLARFAAMWGLSSLVTVAMLVVLGATVGEALRAAALFGAWLAFAGVLLRDYARGVVASRLQPLVLAVAALAALLATSAAMRGKFAGELWCAVALAGVTAAALFVWRRWRRMAQAAPAFPAGRNG